MVSKTYDNLMEAFAGESGQQKVSLFRRLRRMVNSTRQSYLKQLQMPRPSYPKAF